MHPPVLLLSTPRYRVLGELRTKNVVTLRIIDCENLESKRRCSYVPGHGFIHDGHPLPELTAPDRHLLEEALQEGLSRLPTLETRQLDRDEVVRQYSDGFCRLYSDGEWVHYIQVFTHKALNQLERQQIIRQFRTYELWTALREGEPDVRFYRCQPSPASVPASDPVGRMEYFLRDETQVYWASPYPTREAADEERLARKQPSCWTIVGRLTLEECHQGLIAAIAEARSALAAGVDPVHVDLMLGQAAQRFGFRLVEC